MTWNQHVDYRRAAMEFMGMRPPEASLGFSFLEAPAPRTQRCRRPPARTVEYPERSKVGGRPFSLFMKTPLSDAELAYKPESDRIHALYGHLRPVDAPVDCRIGMPLAMRPCPWAACRFHLGITTNKSGSIRIDHGHLDFDKLADTCAIDVAQRGRATQEEVGHQVGISTDWVRATERDMRQRMTRKARAVSSDWSAPDKDGRETCRRCDGTGEDGPIACLHCDGDGYRWGRG